MGPDQFRAWRKALGLKQKDAAERLGLKKRMIQYYEKGDRNGRPVEIPKAIRLACYALSNGIGDFDGTTPVRAPLEQPSGKPATGVDSNKDRQWNDRSGQAADPVAPRRSKA
ncbi:helix-turn-helix transcriptional regulator [Rhizobiales bacterium]|uniref:helix-turn-helix domain-containing protein n=1 Tax=Hongsoonwoonella zoysiae TaxID=2821844 RepID=UPI0015610061|nr:helix-turn-helix transcriptional regulator [Hongsoonwoonella zoysiae]NRG17713.1 helix-turn-helix transcriptional regulator [Hongsoonwoonella zoysiae]